MFDFTNTPMLFEHERSTNKEFSIPYDKSSMAGSCVALDRMVDRYFTECNLEELINAKIPKKIQTATDRIKRILRSLLWHFNRAAKYDNDLFLSISLRDISYRKNPNVNPHHITREITDIIRLLEENKYIERHPGFLDRTSGNSRCTRIRPNIPLLLELQALPDDISEEYVVPQSVSIRGEYVTTYDAETKHHLDQADKTITEYNEQLRSHKISHTDAMSGFLPYEGKQGSLQLVNITRNSVYAVYHADDEGVLSYGRIHGNMCQAIPSNLRRFITIDDEPTVELDYSAQVVNIVASLERIQLQGDPYEIDLGIQNLDPMFSRDIIKKCLIIMLNVTSKKAACQAVRGHFRKDQRTRYSAIKLTDKFWNGIFERVLAHHPFLSKQCFVGKGKQLFMHDAEIARSILQAFVDAQEVVLPIHDGFIATKRNRDFLERTMKLAWFEKFGTSIEIKEE